MEEMHTMIIPYYKFPHPPRNIDMNAMLEDAKQRLTEWTKTLEPKFKVGDALHLDEVEKQDKGLYLKYTIIRGKYKPKS